MVIQESFVLRSQGGRNVMAFSDLNKALEALDRLSDRGVRLKLFRHVITEREIKRTNALAAQDPPSRNLED